MRTSKSAGARKPSKYPSACGIALTIVAFLRVTIREGRRQYRRKDAPLDWYNKEIAKKPHDVGLWYAKGALLTKSGEHKEAIDCFEKITELDPDHYKGWDAKAKAYFRIGDYEKSISALDVLIEMDEENETLWYQKGEALLKLGRFVEANECYEKAIELSPNYADAWCGKGNALKGIGKETVQREEQDEEETSSRGNMFKDALDCFKKVMSLNPNHYEAMGSKGSLLCEMGRYEEGLREIDRAVEGNPNLYEPLFQKAKVLQLQGNKQEAERVFENLLTQSPPEVGGKGAEDLYWRGVAATESGDYQSALESLNRILVLNPQHVDAWTSKGDVLARMGIREQALGCFDKALFLRPNQGDVWHKKGNALRDLGRLEEALFSYGKATSLTPTSTDAWHEKGLVHYAIEELREALRSFLHVLEIAPSHRAASKMKDRTASKLFGRVDTALELGERNLKEEGGHSQPRSIGVNGSTTHSKDELVYNGIRLFSQQEFDEALECFDLAIKIDSRDFTIWEWKGDTLVKLDRYSEAIECYDRAGKLKHKDKNGENQEAPSLRTPEGVTSQSLLRSSAYGLPDGREGMIKGVGAAINGKRLQKHSGIDEQRGFSIDEIDRSILDALLETPKTIREISRLCETDMATLFPRIEMLCILGFLKRLRAVVTLERGVRRICLYQTERESYLALDA